MCPSQVECGWPDSKQASMVTLGFSSRDPCVITGLCHSIHWQAALEKWKFDAEMSVQSGGALGTSVFFWSENSRFSDWLQETTKTYGGEKRFFWDRFTRQWWVLAIAIMKNLNGQLSHIHRSTDLRVLVDDEHLAVHSHANLFMLLYDFECVRWLVTNRY